ncbi:MAG: hypothetical protein IIA88_04070 [Bacteroidetes bacterium]|nr:hypothetical protein [Bacteroidota bacterium]
MAEREFNLISVIKILLQWKKPIFIVTLITAISSVIISLLLPNYYKSIAIFYPSNPKYFDARIVYNPNADIDFFGSKEDVDRMFSLGNSTQLAHEIIGMYNLYEHYDIDTAKTKFYRLKVLQEYRANVTITKNKYGAIEIEVYDKNKDMAANMANSILGKIDNSNRNIIFYNIKTTLNVYSNAIEYKNTKMKLLVDSLERMREQYGILNHEIESEFLSTEINKANLQLTEARAKLPLLLKHYSPRDTVIINLEAKIRGNEEKLKVLTTDQGKGKLNLISFLKGFEIIKQIENQIENLNEEVGEISDLHRKTESLVNEHIPSVYVIEWADAADRKSKPVRWLICVSSTLIACFCCILAVLIVEYYQKEVKELIK